MPSNRRNCTGMKERKHGFGLRKQNFRIDKTDRTIGNWLKMQRLL